MKRFLLVVFSATVGVSAIASAIDSSATVEPSRQLLTIEDVMLQDRSSQSKKILEAFNLLKSSQKIAVEALSVKDNNSKRRELFRRAKEEAESAKSLVSNLTAFRESKVAVAFIDRIRDNSAFASVLWHTNEILGLALTAQGLQEADAHVQSAKMLIPSIKEEELREVLQRDVNSKDRLLQSLRKQVK